jgi:hypothetical protein
MCVHRCVYLIEAYTYICMYMYNFFLRMNSFEIRSLLNSPVKLLLVSIEKFTQESTCTISLNL